MARGTVNGEAIVSQANTDAYRDEYDRIFGRREAQRGSWVQDPVTGELVSAADYSPPDFARDAPVMTGRCHEGQVAPDGTPIGTRARRAAWQKENGCSDYSDFKGVREKRAKELEARARGEFKRDPELRDHIGRELYKRKLIM